MCCLSVFCFVFLGLLVQGVMCGIDISLPPSSPSVDFHILILLSETTEPTETKDGKNVHQEHLNSPQKTEGVSIYIFDHLCYEVF